MTYTEKIQVRDVHGDIIRVGERLYYSSLQNELEFFPLADPSTKTPVCPNVIGVRQFQNQLNITTRKDRLGNENTLMIYDLNSNQITGTLSDINSYFSVNKNQCEIIYSRKDDGGNLGIYKYDICKGSDSYVMPGSLLTFPLFVPPLVITIARPGSFINLIVGYNIEKQTIAWKFDVKEIGGYYDHLDKAWKDGYVNNLILVGSRVCFLSPIKLICLDAHTGCICWTKDYEKDYSKRLIYDESSGELLMFDLEEFSFIDPSTGNITRQSNSMYSKLRQKGILPSNCTSPVVSDRNIYITFCYEKKIAVIDKFDFSIRQIVDMNSGDIISQSDPPVIYKNYLLQRSMDDVLHIYRNTE